MQILNPLEVTTKRMMQEEIWIKRQGRLGQMFKVMQAPKEIVYCRSGQNKATRTQKLVDL